MTDHGLFGLRDEIYFLIKFDGIFHSNLVYSCCEKRKSIT